jgi:hypothetical protein
VFDAADGGDYYARKRNELFRQRHPGGELLVGGGGGLVLYMLATASVAFNDANIVCEWLRMRMHAHVPVQRKCCHSVWCLPYLRMVIVCCGGIS